MAEERKSRTYLAFFKSYTGFEGRLGAGNQADRWGYGGLWGLLLPLIGHKSVTAGLVMMLAMPAAADSLHLPEDPRELDAFAIYSRAGACKGIPRCLDGHHARTYRDEWMAVELEWLDLPVDTTVLWLQGLLNITHPRADTSTCYVQVSVATDDGVHLIDSRDSRQYVFRAMSSTPGGSIRDSQLTMAKVQDGRIMVRYTFRANDEEYPKACSYGIRVSVAGWGR